MMMMMFAIRHRTPGEKREPARARAGAPSHASYLGTSAGAADPMTSARPSDWRSICYYYCWLAGSLAFADIEMKRWSMYI
jgi:hypothetical protein